MFITIAIGLWIITTFVFGCSLGLVAARADEYSIRWSRLDDGIAGPIVGDNTAQGML